MPPLDVVAPDQPARRAKARGYNRHVPTLRELAAVCNVSPATVSRVLNGSERVRPETRERILAMMRELDYVPTRAARTLSTKESGLIAVILATAAHPELEHPFFQGLLEQFRHRICEAGYDPILLTGEALGAGDQYYVRRLRMHNVDGVLFLSVRGEDVEIDELRKTGIPIVAFDPEGIGPFAARIQSDNVAAGASVAEHLVAIGRQRIATITGLPETAPSRLRLEGFAGALAAAGRELPPEYVVPGDFYATSGMAGTEQLLSLPEPPDAIFAMSDLMAIATIQTLQRRGLRVPEDVAVVGFDDIRFARLVTPPLTTVRQDLDTLGRLAAETLVAMIRDRDLEPPTLTVPTTLVVRESTGGSTLEEDARSVLDLL